MVVRIVAKARAPVPIIAWSRIGLNNSIFLTIDTSINDDKKFARPEQGVPLILYSKEVSGAVGRGGAKPELGKRFLVRNRVSDPGQPGGPFCDCSPPGLLELQGESFHDLFS